ncbi:MAG: SigE family RNA polymerase sigma factor [Actinomycetota bacterium]
MGEDSLVGQRNGVGANAGWPAPLVDLYRSERTGLVRLAYLLTGEAEAAEEIVQDAFIATRTAWSGVRNPLPYVRRAVVNRAKSWGRHQRVVRAHQPTGPVPTPFEADELWDALGRLNERQRAAIVLRYYEDLPHRDIAELLGCRPATVRTAIHRGLARLGKEIER